MSLLDMEDVDDGIGLLYKFLCLVVVFEHRR
jgi:hypothetical protein